MHIQALIFHPYRIPLATGQIRSGIFLHVTDEKGNSGWGDVAPLPQWSRETLEEALLQLKKKRQEIIQIDWTADACLDTLAELNLLPSVSFGLESALLSLLKPLSAHSIATSALLMGSLQEILQQAKLRAREGYTSAKLKVSHFTFAEAANVICQLKDQFRLRIDVNRAWRTTDSMEFFSQFPSDAFDYVEEPCQNPHDLALFPHPLAVDESFPQDLSLSELESLPTLKALIYKPTIRGGMVHCLPLHKWAVERGITLVLSSSFESDLGLAHIASMAQRLSLSAPVGIGTYHLLQDFVCAPPLQFFGSTVHIPALLAPKHTSTFGRCHKFL